MRARRCVAGALVLGAGRRLRRSAQLGGRRRRPHRGRHRRRSPRCPSASGQPARSPGDGEDGAILRVHGHAAAGRGRVYQVWVQRDGDGRCPQPTFEVGEDGGGAVAVPDDLAGAEAVLVTREPRGGARAPSEHADPHGRGCDAAQLAFSRGGDLLPPPEPRDRRALLELRAADLPRLHDPRRSGCAARSARASARQVRDDARDHGRAGAHLRPDRDLRGRLRRRGGRRRERHRQRLRRQPAVRGGRAARPDGRRRRLLAARHRRLPARRLLPPALQHVLALDPRHDARAGDRARCASR